MPVAPWVPEPRTRSKVMLCILLAASIGVSTCASRIEPPAVRSPAPNTVTTNAPSAAVQKPIPPEGWERRWLEGIPCSPPCWEAITPGATTPQQAVEALSKSPIVGAAQMETSPLISDRGYVTWTWVTQPGPGGMATYDAKNPSGPIRSIDPYLPTCFRFKDIIQAYGQPGYVVARSRAGPDIGSGFYYDVRIIYRTKGSLLVSTGSGRGSLNADSLFSIVIFFALDEAAFQEALGGAADQPELLVPWQGMNEFSFYCRDEGGQPCRQP